MQDVSAAHVENIPSTRRRCEIVWQVFTRVQTRRRAGRHVGDTGVSSHTAKALRFWLKDWKGLEWLLLSRESVFLGTDSHQSLLCSGALCAGRQEEGSGRAEGGQKWREIWTKPAKKSTTGEVSTALRPNGLFPHSEIWASQVNVTGRQIST